MPRQHKRPGKAAKRTRIQRLLIRLDSPATHKPNQIWYHPNHGWVKKSYPYYKIALASKEWVHQNQSNSPG